MSEWRIPDITISIRANKNGNKTYKINIYNAKSFKSKSLRCRKKFFPKGYYEENYLENMFRVRINDKWLRRGKYQYSFFTKHEIDNIIADITRI